MSNIQDDSWDKALNRPEVTIKTVNLYNEERYQYFHLLLDSVNLGALSLLKLSISEPTLLNDPMVRLHLARIVDNLNTIKDIE